MVFHRKPRPTCPQPLPLIAAGALNMQGVPCGGDAVRQDRREICGGVSRHCRLGRGDMNVNGP